MLQETIRFMHVNEWIKTNFSYTTAINNEILVFMSNEEGKVEWLPQIHNINFPWIEIEIKFAL